MLAVLILLATTVLAQETKTSPVLSVGTMYVEEPTSSIDPSTQELLGGVTKALNMERAEKELDQQALRMLYESDRNDPLRWTNFI